MSKVCIGFGLVLKCKLSVTAPFVFSIFLPSLWPKVRCGCAVIGPFLLLNTKIRSSPAYSRKKGYAKIAVKKR